MSTATPLWRRSIYIMLIVSMMVALLYLIMRAGNPYRLSYPYWYKLVSSVDSEVLRYGELLDSRGSLGLSVDKSLAEAEASLKSKAEKFAKPYTFSNESDPTLDNSALPPAVLLRMQRDIGEPNPRFPKKVERWLSLNSDRRAVSSSLKDVLKDLDETLESIEILAEDNLAAEALILRIKLVLQNYLSDKDADQPPSLRSMLDTHWSSSYGSHLEVFGTDIEVAAKLIEEIALKRQELVDIKLKENDSRNAILSELTLLEQMFNDRQAAAEKATTKNRLRVVLLILAFFLFVIVLSVLNRRLARKLAVENDALETKIEERIQELTITNQSLADEKLEGEKLIEELNTSQNRLEAIVNSVHGCIVESDPKTGEIHFTNDQVVDIWGVPAEELASTAVFMDLVHPDDRESMVAAVDSVIATKQPRSFIFRVCRPDGDTIWVRGTSSASLVDGEFSSLVSVNVNIDDDKKASAKASEIKEELAQAQKLESVGRLSAGIAHEINTPSQFVSDNLSFLSDSLSDLFELIKGMKAAALEHGDEALSKALEKMCAKADLDYLADEIPEAVEQSTGGIKTIASIVRAMKDYSHPGESFEPADINHGVTSSITVSRSEWKSVANLTTNLAEDLPLVECVLSDINQVVLNMVVNAAHAIEEKQSESGKALGEIVVTTAATDENVSIAISDTGAGFDEGVKEKIFEQFFTTKGVGKGTGQGLSLAYRMIVEKHHGKIDVDSTLGVGTCFTILLPLEQPGAANEASPESETRHAG